MMRFNNGTLFKERLILIVLCVILAGVVGWLIGSSMAEEPDWDVCYPMANTNIQWTYAEVNVK